jgi:hypothetical protein
LEQQAPIVTVSTDATSVNNGELVNVTVTLNAPPHQALSATSAAAAYFLVSQSGSTYHVWPGLVVTP